MSNIAKSVFDPPTLSAKTISSIERNQAGQGVSFNLGIPGMSSYIMARDNKLNGILADTSQGKTSMMSAISRNLSSQINPDSEIGIFVTWEDTVEDFTLNDIANYSKIPLASLYHGDVKEYQFKKMLRGAAERAKSPVWVIGQSETVVGVQPRMTMTDVSEAVAYIVGVTGKKVKFVMFDYLQRISTQDIQERDTRMKFSGVVDKVKEFTIGFHPATFLGTQVSRSKVESSKWRQPQIHWAMETANFEHACDGAFSMWMVSKSKDIYKIGEPLDNTDFHVTPELMLIDILKQKKASTNIDPVAVDFIPEYNMFVGYGQAENVRNKIQAENPHV